MAWMDQSRKKQLVALAKVVLNKYGVKATFSTDRSGIHCNIHAGGLDFITNFNTIRQNNPHKFGDKPYQAKDYVSVNTYHISTDFSGVEESFLTELKDALNTGNHDKSDISTDYFDVGWYAYIEIGSYKNPYKYIPGISKAMKVTNMRGPTQVKSHDYEVKLFAYDAPTKTFSADASALGWAVNALPPKHIMLKGTNKKVLYVRKTMNGPADIFEFVPTKNSLDWTPACKDTVIKVFNT